MKILLLEDNVSLAEIIKEMLEKKGHNIDWFEDGEKALFAITDGYDCFILDVQVPNMDGISLLKEIREREKKTPILIISANTELEIIQKAYVAGCQDFLKKPFYMYELEKKIDLLFPSMERILLDEGYTFSLKDEVLYTKENKPIELTLKERRFLVLLAKTPNIAVSNDLIEQYVWEGREASILGLRGLVKRLRKKMSEKSIKTQAYAYKLVTRDPF
ncbi:MAG: response regulator transcription factor [Campylobacteraceae bacterium]